MKVYVLSKMQFDSALERKGISDANIEDKNDHFFISINNTIGGELPTLKNHPNVKVMHFDDLEQDEEKYNPSTGLYEKIFAFSPEQAQELYEFIMSNKDKKTCVVHCSAGISRSGAVGEFINDLFGESYAEFKRENPHTLPNNLVKRLLMAEAMRNFFPE